MPAPSRGMICAPQPLAVEAGADILLRGGTAVDAAIAAALVQGVVDPQMCGLGGGGSATVHDAATGETDICDFYACAPLAAREDMFADRIVGEAGWGGFILEGRINEIGYRSICTPTAVAGMGALHARYGSLPWADLFGPAIEIAEVGAPVYHHVHERWSRQVGGYVDCITRHEATTTCASQYMSDGRMLVVGEKMATSAYAKSLRRLAKAGSQDFVDGEIAHAMVSDFSANGGYITLRDLANAEPIWRKPIKGMYRGVEVEGPPPPGAGVAVIAILNILSGFDIGALEYNGPEHLHLLASAIRLGLDDWKAHTGDPAFIDNPVEWLTSEMRAEALRSMIGKPADEAWDGVPDGRDTTHISVMMADGSGVSMTHTLGLGSGVVTRGLGFMYNDAMMLFDPRPGRPNSIAPGRVRQHGLASCILSKNGRPIMVVGAPGGHGIISGVVQTICNVLDFGMTPVEAVSAPRIHCESAFIDIEARIPIKTVKALERMGHKVRPTLYSYDFFAGRPHVVVRDLATGQLQGGADPRSGGMALAG